MDAYELRARWWLVAAACVMASFGAEMPQKLELVCTERTGCYATKNPEVFWLNGHDQKISYLDGITFETSCSVASLDEDIWPYFIEPISFPVATLRNCSPPVTHGSYINFLRSLNITTYGRLRLLDLPSDAEISAHNLFGVPLDLDMRAVEGSVLHLKPSTLRNLDHVRSLILHRVHFDQLPPNLMNLIINRTGIEILDSDRIMFLSGHLEIEEELIQDLSLKLPFVNYIKINAPYLFALTISEASVSALSSGFLSGCEDLDTLVLLRLKRAETYKTMLPRQLLKSLPSLVNFALIQSEVVLLPADVFAYTPNVKTIDLSRNHLETIPDDLFLGLKNLTSIDLADNKMYLPDLWAFNSIHKLTKLILRGNRIDTFCPEGGDSMLPKFYLEHLDVSFTNLTQVCPDFIGDKQNMRIVNLSNNAIESLGCLIGIYRLGAVQKTVVDMTNNNINEFTCTAEDLDRAVDERVDPQHVELLLSHLSCDCVGFWLKETLGYRRVQVTVLDPVPCPPVTCKFGERMVNSQDVVP